MQPIDFGGWMRGGASIVKAQAPLRAEIERMRILDKDTDIELLREGIRLDSQTVRIEWDDISADATDASGDSTRRVAIIFGIQGHPSLPDTDIKTWDTFVFEDVEYTVVSVNKRMHGVIQAECEVVG
jgi:hypothetical protein